ncbi:hypothetical protein HDE_05638 [Halotydeus destructor]|nr:hypothetical protein HDE_05638 [Halotydeus destructor]
MKVVFVLVLVVFTAQVVMADNGGDLSKLGHVFELLGDLVNMFTGIMDGGYMGESNNRDDDDDYDGSEPADAMAPQQPADG